MADPVIIKEGNDSGNGFIIGIIVAALVGLVIRAIATDRIDMWNKQPEQVDVKVEAPAELPSVNDIVWPDEAPATNDTPSMN